MKVWLIIYTDEYDYFNPKYEIWDSEEKATERCAELNSEYKTASGQEYLFEGLIMNKEEM